jgi:hypothetical protein
MTENGPEMFIKAGGPLVLPTAVRIDGGEPVLEAHHLAVVPSVFEDEVPALVVVCLCGARLPLEWHELSPFRTPDDDGPEPWNGNLRGLSVGDLIWLAIEHRKQLAQEAPA